MYSLIHTYCLADETADNLSERHHRHLLQAGATLPTFYGKTSAWRKYFLAIPADTTPGLPR